MKEGKKSKMTGERLQKLQEVGLEMTVQERKTFDERAAEWLEYRTKHGRGNKRKMNMEKIEKMEYYNASIIINFRSVV